MAVPETGVYGRGLRTYPRTMLQALRQCCLRRVLGWVFRDGWRGRPVGGVEAIREIERGMIMNRPLIWIRCGGRHPARCAAAWLLVAMTTAWAAGPSDEFAVHDGDRVVIYGDSITAGYEYQGYPRYVEAYLRTRHPEWTTRVWNRGVSGDNAGNLDRFKRDCLSLKPDVILFNMGMNDAGGSPEIAPRLRRYVSNITAVVAAAREVNPKVRFVLISPILYESRAPGTSTFYAYVLRSYAREERELARRLHAAYIDLNREYGETVGLAEGLFPGSIIFSGDGIHPLPNGGCLFIAVHILKGLGAGSDLTSLHIDAAAGKIVSVSGAAVEMVKGPEGTVAFDRMLSALPFPVVETAGGVTYRDRAVAFLVEVADDLNRDTLKVTGLPAKAYGLRIDDRDIAELAADELADGVNLSRFFHTPDQDQAVAVSDAVGRKQIAEAKLWRSNAATKNGASGTASNAQVEAASAALRTISHPSRHRFTLAPLDHEVDRYRSYEQLLDISGPGPLAVREDGAVRQDITIVVRNISPCPRHVELTWDGPGATPSIIVTEFAAGEKREVSFAVALSAGAPMPRLTVKHQPVDLSFPPLAQVCAPVLAARLDVRRNRAPIVADGDLGEWTGPAQIDFEARMMPATRRHRAGRFQRAGACGMEPAVSRRRHPGSGPGPRQSLYGRPPRLG